MYGIGGERDLTESTLDHLSGYEDAQPGAGRQRRLQPEAARRLGRAARLGLPATRSPATTSPSASGRSSSRQVEQAIEHWREPDRGIWEVRGEPKHFTSSKLFCWVALDRGARLADRRGEEALEQKWRAVADEIHADICANGVDERGVFTQHYGTNALDASLLLMPLVRFLPPRTTSASGRPSWRSPTS